MGTITAPAQAKNVITVGATLRANEDDIGYHYVTYFSSRGSANDRIKPDICTSGYILSAKSLSEKDCAGSCNNHDNIVTMSGTYPFKRGFMI